MNTDLAVEKVQFIRALDALIEYHHQIRERIGKLTATGEKKMTGFDWASFAIRILTNVPVIVSGIEQIHGDTKSGAEKKQLAMEALGLAYTGASAVVPSQQPVIDATATLASQAIDGVVSVMNAAKANQPPKMPSAAVSSPNPGIKPPVPISPLAPQTVAEPAGEVQKAPSSLDSSAPSDSQEQNPPAKSSLWP